MEKHFFLPMIPPTVTHQEKQVRVVKRNGKPVPQFYEPAKVKAARAKLLDSVARYKPDAPMTGPVQLQVTWCFPLDKGGIHRDGEPKSSKPDTDNLQKLLKDCMTKAGFWFDDAQVCREVAEKFWAEIPGLYIRVAEWEAAMNVDKLRKRYPNGFEAERSLHREVGDV